MSLQDRQTSSDNTQRKNIFIERQSKIYGPIISYTFLSDSHFFRPFLCSITFWWFLFSVSIMRHFVTTPYQWVIFAYSDKFFTFLFWCFCVFLLCCLLLLLCVFYYNFNEVPNKNQNRNEEESNFIVVVCFSVGLRSFYWLDSALIHNTCSSFRLLIRFFCLSGLLFCYFSSFFRQ